MKQASTLPHTAIFAVAVLGIAIFCVMDAVMKGLVIAIGAYTALFWRSLAGAIISGALYYGRPRTPMTRAALRVHALRGAVTTVMAVAFFWGLARVPMAQAIALTFTAPLLSLYLAALLLGERIHAATIVASALAFAGVLVILVGQWHEDVGPDAWHGALAVMASSLLYAFNIVLMRRQALVAAPVEVAYSQSLVVTVLLALGSPFFAHVPDVRHVPLILLGAVLAVVALLLLAWAYARSDANRLSPSEYTSFLWAALFGWIVFDERVTSFTLAGAVLIVLGCVVAAQGRRSGNA